MKIRTTTILRLRDAMLESGRRPSVVVSPAYETLARAGLLSMEETAALSRVEPLAETMFLMVAADGSIADQERDALRGAVRGLSDNLLRTGTINVMLENFEQRLRDHGRDERLREIAEELSDHPSDAESAFTLAAAVALADDEVHDEEQSFINQLAEWLGINAARAGELLDQLEADRRSVG
ncbi:MAG TPA: TerB family tellurite resistance protein [Polyangiaceae bacterium]|nr:TerB family tellurite resistance protein [Polyangiaceae bacterium]